MRETLTRVTIFSGSLLLFLIQPMFARMVLPSLGGSAQVWNTCVLFFSTTLLLGYGYAHLLTRFLSSRAQRVVHGGVVLCGLLVLPVALDSSLPEGAPTPWLLKTLAMSVGLPVFALAATSPLLSKWFAASDSRGAKDPYFLYASSNAGSLLALAAYPMLLDPLASLSLQSRLWSWAYGIFGVLLLVNAFRLQGKEIQEPLSPETLPRWRWLALAFVVSSLMLGVTAHMTQEVPSIPLLWVIPLMLYLLSFILVFAKRQILSHAALVALIPIWILVLAIVLFVPVRILGFSLHLGAFFVTAMVLHGELALSRPSAARLTEFYLWIAAGGALGGAFNALVAPLLFPFVAEYPLALFLSCLLLPPTKAKGSRRFDVIAPAILAAAIFIVFRFIPQFGDERDVFIAVFLLFFTALPVVLFRHRRLRFALGIAAILAAGIATFRFSGVESMARSYYGSYRVVRKHGTRFLLHHGTTIHGAQDHSVSQPISYFHPDSPIAGIVGRVSSDARIGVIGLGVGALAWYVKPSQRLRYFEIDPLVVSLARDERYFNFLASAKGTVDVVTGDGRLTLGREPDSSFELVVADAFSSDAVPIHLLTREAIALYISKLAPGGALLINTSNRHLRLPAVAAALGRSLDLVARSCLRPPLSILDEKAGKARASWLILSRSDSDLLRWTLGDACWVSPPIDDVPVWTDDYASVLPVIRWW